MAVGGALIAGAVLLLKVGNYMNHLGGNKGLNLNISRKWYLPSYPEINRTEPKGFNSIWDVWDAVKGRVSQIVKSIGASNIKTIAGKSTTNRVCVLAQMIYDAYSGKRIVKSNYKIS